MCSTFPNRGVNTEDGRMEVSGSNVRGASILEGHGVLFRHGYTMVETKEKRRETLELSHSSFPLPAFLFQFSYFSLPAFLFQLSHSSSRTQVGRQAGQYGRVQYSTVQRREKSVDFQACNFNFNFTVHSSQFTVTSQTLDSRQSISTGTQNPNVDKNSTDRKLRLVCGRKGI